jgi:hypothetical protein
VTDLPRRYLLTLLLRSYLDVLPGLHHEHGDDIGYISRGKGSGASKAPFHASESRRLWNEGSYARLEKALTELRQHDACMYHAVYVVYIYQPPRRAEAYDRQISVEHERQRHMENAEWGLRWLEKRMPQRIRVPLDVMENDGNVRRPL